jgi:PAS domain S-box-containing protein
VHVLISSWQYENPKNGDIEYEGIIKDITHRKFLEDDLKLSESKYRRIFEGSKDMIFITAKNGAIKEVNQACVDRLGYDDKQEVLSLNSVEKIYHNPMHWRVFQKQIDRHGFVQDFEAGFKKKDGTRIHCLLSGNAVRGDNEQKFSSAASRIMATQLRGLCHEQNSRSGRHPNDRFKKGPRGTGSYFWRHLINRSRTVCLFSKGTSGSF